MTIAKNAVFIGLQLENCYLVGGDKNLVVGVVVVVVVCVCVCVCEGVVYWGDFCRWEE